MSPRTAHVARTANDIHLQRYNSLSLSLFLYKVTVSLRIAIDKHMCASVLLYFELQCSQMYNYSRTADAARGH
jgi:hypothetical protein